MHWRRLNDQRKSVCNVSAKFGDLIDIRIDHVSYQYSKLFRAIQCAHDNLSVSHEEESDYQ